jgi:AraC-like DNA-binding protein
MFYVSGIIIAFFLTVLLSGKKDKTPADKLLALWLFFIGLHLFLYHLNFSEKIFELPFLLGMEHPFPLIHGPFLYLYTASLCNLRTRWPKYWMLHFVPALVCYLYLIHFFMLPSEQKIWVYQNQGAGYEVFSRIKLSAIVISGICYVVLSGILLRKHEKNIHNLFSYEEKINLKWLQYPIAGIALIWLAIPFASSEVVFAMVVLFVLFVGIFGIRQVGIFTNVPSFNQDTPNNGSQIKSPDFKTSPKVEVAEADSTPDDEPLPTQDQDKRKYLKSGLTETSAQQLHEQLRNLMEVQKLYRESELSLTDLAERLNTHPNYISQVINEKEGKNFFDYINTMRIGEFMELASNPKNKHYTLLALAMDCGFNSKSSFIRYFKKVTGHAPSRYLQTQID